MSKTSPTRPVKTKPKQMRNRIHQGLAVCGGMQTKSIVCTVLSGGGTWYHRQPELAAGQLQLTKASLEMGPEHASQLQHAGFMCGELKGASVPWHWQQMCWCLSWRSQQSRLAASLGPAGLGGVTASPALTAAPPAAAGSTSGVLQHLSLSPRTNKTQAVELLSSCLYTVSLEKC